MILDHQFKDLSFLRNELCDIDHANLEIAASGISANQNLKLIEAIEASSAKKKNCLSDAFGDSYHVPSVAHLCTMTLPIEGTDILKCRNAGMSPHLSQLAKKYLSIPATSVSSERVFSIAGNVLNNCQSSRNCQKILFHENLKDFNVIYANLTCDLSSSSGDSANEMDELVEHKAVGIVVSNNSESH